MKVSFDFACCTVILLSILPLTMFLSKYLPYRIKANSASSVSQKVQKGPIILNHLQQLTGMPLVGQLFYEDKIYYLSLLGSWQRVINESETALETIMNEKSFEIWYYKGVAECILKKFEKCQESALTAFYLSSKSLPKKEIVKGLLQHMQRQKSKMDIDSQSNQAYQSQINNMYLQYSTQARVIYKQSQQDVNVGKGNQQQQYSGIYWHQNGNYKSLIEL